MRDAELLDGRRVDVHIQGGQISSLGPGLAPSGMNTWDVQGCALSPALSDHHLHLFAAAAAAHSLDCAPPAINSRSELQKAIACAKTDADGWVRAVAFHPAQVGEIDRTVLDAWRADVPVRVQHVTGRRWTFNSAGITRLGDEGPWERYDGCLSGHLVDHDAWLAQAMNCSRSASRVPPDLTPISRTLASYGVVAVTDTGPANDAGTLTALRLAHEQGQLRQRVQMMGNASLDALYQPQAVEREPVAVGPHKFHLLESQLPDFDELCAAIRRSHSYQRPVAFHCVTRSELVFALAALESTGVLRGDRIEHAGVCPDEQARVMAQLGIWVVTQPEFVWRKGDRYLAEVATEDQPWLYRLAGLQRWKVGLAASSDAPYGDLNPWCGIAAACQRRTRLGQWLGPDEALTFSQALALYTGGLNEPCVPAAPLSVGQCADLCVLNHPWSKLRDCPGLAQSQLTLARGQIIWS